MKKIVFFRVVFVAVLCLVIAMSACEKNSENNNADTKKSETTEMTELFTNASDESKNDDELEASTEKDEITTEAIEIIETAETTTEKTTEETETYEKLTDGPGVSMPEVEV